VYELTDNAPKRVVSASRNASRGRGCRGAPHVVPQSLRAPTPDTPDRDGVIVAAHHPPEFRRRAVELARRGDHPIAALAQRLQISESCLHRWVLQADIDDNGSDSRLTSAEKRELAQLRRDKRRLERENQILKRAVAYLARKNLFDDPAPPGGSVIAQRGSAEVDAACGV
jgi:transposase